LTAWLKAATQGSIDALNDLAKRFGAGTPASLDVDSNRVESDSEVPCVVR
jgi:hypothetical protein